MTDEWEEGQATANDKQSAVLAQTENWVEKAIAVLQQRRRTQACTELRAAASLLRLETQSINEESRELRSSAEPWSVLPLTVTTRHVRSLEP